MTQPCALFVPTVRGSSVCSVCRCAVEAHAPESIYYPPSMFIQGGSHAPNRSKTSTEQVIYSNPQQLASGGGGGMPTMLDPPSATALLAPSHNSAFTKYRRSPDSPRSAASSVQGSAAPPLPSTNPPLLRPTPRRNLPLPSPSFDTLRSVSDCSLTDRSIADLPHDTGVDYPVQLLSPHAAPDGSPYSEPAFLQDDRSDSCIYKKIHGKRKERSNSVGGQPYNTSPSPSNTSSVQFKPCHVLPRENDFRSILSRFQSQEAESLPLHPSQTPRLARNRRFTCEIGRLDLPLPAARNTSHDDMTVLSASERPFSPPSRRNSTPREYTQPPLRAASRSNSSRTSGSRLTEYDRRSAMQSPLSQHDGKTFSPVSHCSSIVSMTRADSPLSHTGSTPPPVTTNVTIRRAPPLTITIPTPKARRSLPPRWVKETDIDDPTSLPVSPTFPAPHSLSNDDSESSPDGIPTPPRSAPLVHNEALHRIKQLKYGGSCRRILDELPSTRAPSGIYVRRSRSRDDRPLLANAFPESRSSVVPITMEGSVSPRLSPESEREERRRELERAAVEAHYAKMNVHNLQTLSAIGERLADSQRRREEPVSRNRLHQLEFSDFVFKSSEPSLVKGQSLFFDAVLPRAGHMGDYECTLMIAPSSPYSSHRSDSPALAALPAFVTLDDQQGEVEAFLRDTEWSLVSRGPCRVAVMPRLHLCSFHSLAAHHLHKTLEAETHERHVCFIMVQLLAALKALQSDGIESLSNNFVEFLLAYRYTSFSSSSVSDLSEFPQLLFLPHTLDQEETELVGLCRYALRTLCTLLHHRMDGRAPRLADRSVHSRALLAAARILQDDKSASLTAAKNVLECSVWAGGARFEDEFEARLWLDARRADAVHRVLHSLLDSPSSVGIRDRMRVAFLLSASPRALRQSHMILHITSFS